MIRIGIVDDHAIMRNGLRQFLSEHDGLCVVGEAANGAEAIDLVRDTAPDVLLLDLSMPERSGLEALATIQAKAVDMAILVLSAYPEEHYAINLIRRGARGYLNKDCDPADIIHAIRAVASGERYVSATVAQLLAQQVGQDTDGPAHQQLSDREFEVFLGLARGQTVGELADALALSVKTISTYRSRVLEKMQLHSNSDLTYYALKTGLID